MKLSGTELSLSSIRGLAMTAYVKQLPGLEVKIEALENFNGRDVKLKTKHTSDSTPIPPAIVKTWHLYNGSVRCRRKLFHVTTAQHSKTAKHSERHGAMINDDK